MINLLPLPHKESQHKERRLRSLTVFLTLFLVVEIVSVVILAGPYFLASTKIRIAEAELIGLEKKLQEQGGENYADVVESTNEKLDYFFDEDERPLANSSLLLRIMEKIPTGVSITDFSIGDATLPKDPEMAIPAHARSLYIGGVASTRTSLLAFVDALKSTEGITHVALPVSNFTESTNIDFSVTLIAF